MNHARREVARQRARLDETFNRIDDIDEDATETQADFAKYLCVRVSGYLETSVAELLQAYTAQQSGPNVARYMGSELRRFQNATYSKLLDLFEKFNENWRADLAAFLVDEKADAIGTIVTNRHKIAHGQDSDLTYIRVRRHWEVIQEIVDHIADLVDP